MPTLNLKPYIDILKLVWPLALGMINNAVMQFADRAYLSRYSQGALEAVLPAGILMWIFAGFFQSVVGYSSVFVGQFQGEGSGVKCRETYRAALILAAGAGLLSLPLVGLGDWILGCSTSNAALLADERAYYRILMAGSFAIYGQMAAASYFTGRGHTRIVFWTNLAGNVLNVALDPLLIFGIEGTLSLPFLAAPLHFHFPSLGIAGAAYATVVAMSVQMSALMLAAERAVCRQASAKGVRFGILWRILRFGVPSGFYTVLNMLSFAIFVFVSEGVGELELAVSNACFTVNYLLFAPMEGFALGASTLVAQAIGRGDPDAAVHAARRTLLLGVGFAALSVAAALLLAGPILDLFAATVGERAAEFHELGMTLLLLMAAWLLFDATDVILGGALKGAGDTKFVMGWALVCAFFLWLPLVFVVRHYRNTMPALWATMIVYVVVICIGSTIRWCRGRWRHIRLV
ncbi:MAG: MATE family efflux transporter [Kiritimatiellia bacterium]